MQNFIDYINISNFKSIRDLKLEGLTRINLFIGKPNVGKSNILEAFGVFSLPFLELNPIKKLYSFIRVEHQNELFFDGNSLDSAVLIRYIEFDKEGGIFYRSGGGITINSNVEEEYMEMINKIYLPLRR